MTPIAEPEFAPARLAVLLQHFAEIDDDRESWRVAHPLKEVLLLVTCATIANCDDFEAIVAWGEHHLDFLRRFGDFHHGVPCARWLRDLMNRIDPVLFARCFEAFVASMWPQRHGFIAIDGKTARRTHDKRKDLKALHTLSAYATSARLTLAQLSVPEKTNEITAIPDLLDTLAGAGQLDGAVVTIDAMGCQVAIAQKIIDHGADYVLSLKGNQPTLEADVLDYFRTAPAGEIVSTTTIEKDHGRIETRHYRASANVDWIASDRRYPGEPRFPGIKTLVQVHRTTEASRPDQLRNQRLPRFAAPQHRPHRHRHPRPLGRRGHALDPRRPVQGRPLPLPTGLRSQKYGRRPTLRPRPRPRPQDQG